MNVSGKISIFIIFLSLPASVQSQDNIGLRISENILSVERASVDFLARLELATEMRGTAKFFEKEEVDYRVDLTAAKFDPNDLATFCRLELKLEKAAKFPIKFRLGEVQYVERMEGKY